jgi:hypothetical protein
MTKIVQFVPKSDLERERLIREARAIYDSIFSPVAVGGEHACDRSGTCPAPNQVD